MSQDVAAQNLATPKTPIILIKPGTGETLKLGPITCHHRIGTAEFIVPPNTTGHPPHWHQMHDEIFLVTTGTVQFRGANGIVDARPGDCVVVPIGAPHTFSNIGQEEARFVNTFNPSYYINYFRLLAAMYADKPDLDEETVLETMHPFGTLVAHGL